MKAALTAYLLCIVFLPMSPCAQASAQESEPSREVLWTPPGVVLEGVIVASNPDASVALVRRQGASRGRSVQVGKTIFGMSLIAVSEEAALFDLGGRQVWLFLDGSAVVPSPAIAGMSGPADDASPVGDEGGAEVDEEFPEEQWIVKTVARVTLESRLDNEIEAILAQTSIVLRRDTETKQGLEIQHLAEDTLLAELGLAAGDVLLSINETPIDSLSTLTGVYPTFAFEEELQVVADRRGQIVRIVARVN
jgi:type II secretory pathway component PulC